MSSPCPILVKDDLLPLLPCSFTTEQKVVGWMTSDNALNNNTTMKEVVKVIDEDGVTPTPQATLLKKICHTIDNGDETDIDSLTEQLATLEDDSEAITKDDFDVVDAIGKALTLIEQIHKSPQARAFSKKSCEERGIPIHKILAWVRTRWASLFKCLKHFLSLCLAINRFTLLADKSPEVLKLHNKSYSDFKLDRADWKKIWLMCNVLKEPTTAQQSFSSAAHLTASQTIPTLECLANTWQTMAGSTEYVLITDAIQKGLKNVGKYYEKTGNLYIYLSVWHISDVTTVLDPNYKLAYVKSRWSDAKVASGRAHLQALLIGM
ncbi:hypothetical protein BDR05DRAFT_944506 [Suillus weaverae]|nr:hypothetical protein BDR05DRAFT_944506 [Suillus weaverae]